MRSQVLVDHVRTVEGAKIVGGGVGRVGVVDRRLVVPAAIEAPGGILIVCPLTPFPGPLLGAVPDHRKTRISARSANRVIAGHPVGNVAIAVGVGEMLADRQLLDAFVKLVHAGCTCEFHETLNTLGFTPPMPVGVGNNDRPRVVRIVGKRLDDRTVRTPEDREGHRISAGGIDGLHAVEGDTLRRLHEIVQGMGMAHLHRPRVVRRTADDDTGNAGDHHAGDLHSTTTDRTLHDDGRQGEAHLRTRVHDRIAGRSLVTRDRPGVAAHLDLGVDLLQRLVAILVLRANPCRRNP